MILLGTQLARADSAEIPNLKPDSPTGHTSLDFMESKNLALYIKQCKVDKKDLKDVKDSYDLCRGKIGKELQLWQRPEGATTLGVLIFLLGGVAGSQL